jgi:hypothetical protein
VDAAHTSIVDFHTNLEDDVKDISAIGPRQTMVPVSPSSWVPPAIAPQARSPFLLRCCRLVGSAEVAVLEMDASSGERERLPVHPSSVEVQIVGVEVVTFGTEEDVKFTIEEATLQTNDECTILEDGAFATLDPIHARRAPPITRQTSLHMQLAICRFIVEDFILGIVEPNPYLRQSIGEYLPWLHDCRERTCPFIEPPYEVRRESLERGMPLSNSDMSPRKHIRVHKRAFTRPMTVKVKLEHLSYDFGLWEGLEEFAGLVVDRYYQVVTESLMFTINFGGSIGQYEIKVCNTRLDGKK